MLITTSTELEHYYPTSKWDKCEALLPLFKETEQNALRRQIGGTLLAQLNADYAALATDNGLPFDQDDDSIQYRVLQAAGAYITRLTLANNERTFSTTFNRGGGWNMSTSDHFSTPDEDQFKALAKELYMLSQDALENLCIALEDDAKTDRHYTEAWKGSRTYYNQTELLIPNADTLQQYLDIDSRRERFTALVPLISRIQSRVITPRIGTHWLRLLLALQVSGGSVPDGSVPVPDASASGPVPDGPAPGLAEMLHNLRIAIALNILAEQEKSDKSRERLKTDADYHINIGINHILTLADIFKDDICGTPLDIEYSHHYGEGRTLTQTLEEAKRKEEALAKGEPYTPPKPQRKQPQRGVMTIFSKR